ncbi:MAG: Nif3-like dinuclear metal center hexameric protein [Roseburia sp.]
MTFTELKTILEELAPADLALEWDNVGLLVGDKRQGIHTAYLALDATDDVIREATRCGADLLITHHPLIFRSMKQVTMDDFVGRRIQNLVRNGISYYAMHTNFDVCVMGDLAAERMQLEHTQVLEVTGNFKGEPCGIGKVGNLAASVSLQECADLVKEKFDVPHVTVYGDLGRQVQRIAIAPGSGGDEIPYAVTAQADVLITGDISHHKGIDALAQGLCIIDAGHYGLEHIFTDYMEAYLKEHAPCVEVQKCGHIMPYEVI